MIVLTKGVKERQGAEEKAKLCNTSKTEQLKIGEFVMIILLKERSGDEHFICETACSCKEIFVPVNLI